MPVNSDDEVWKALRPYFALMFTPIAVGCLFGLVVLVQALLGVLDYAG